MGAQFKTLYESAMGEEMVAGAYKDINYNKNLPWFEFNDGTYFENRISLLDMLL